MDVINNVLKSETLPKQYRVKVIYTGGIKSDKREAEYILDLNVFNGILETHTRSLTDLTKAVENISETLDELAKNASESMKPF